MWWRAAVVAVGVFAVQAAVAAPAAAHATLASSTPADGAMLDVVPDVVELVFTENVGKPAALVVLDASGAEVPSGELEVLDDTMHLPLLASDAAGTFTISYQVTSADGHPIAGTLTFTVHDMNGNGASSTGPVPRPTVSDPTDAEPAIVLVLAAALAGALGVGLLSVWRLTRRIDAGTV